MDRGFLRLESTFTQMEGFVSPKWDSCWSQQECYIFPNLLHQLQRAHLWFTAMTHILSSACFVGIHLFPSICGYSKAYIPHYQHTKTCGSRHPLGGREREFHLESLRRGYRWDSHDSFSRLQTAVRQNICANPKRQLSKPNFQVFLSPQMVRRPLNLNVRILIHYQ